MLILFVSFDMIAFESLVVTCACLWISALVIGAEEEIGSPLRIAQCRAHCIAKFSNEPESQQMCVQEPDCSMCWENCQLLQANFAVWGGICSETGICFPGCQEACRFHREMSQVQQSVPVIRTRGEEVIFVKNHTAFWPKPSHMRHGSAEPLVYVVMRRLPGRMWRQIIQTLETTSRVPEDLSSGALLRVLVVDRDGLFTIYSPIAAESSLRSANDIARSSGRNGINNLFGNANASEENRTPGSDESTGHGRRINTEIVKTKVEVKNSSEMVEYTTWNLREISLIHQKVLVIAEIAWDAVPAYVVQRPVYFVTWEVDGGGLKGNLFTDSTCVTLSLWPDTVYHIQVELVGHNEATGRPQQSEDFLLDTRGAVAVELETSSPNLSVLNAASEVPATFREIDSNDVSFQLRSSDTQHEGIAIARHDAPLSPHKIELSADKQQFGGVLFAVAAAFAVFLFVLVVQVYVSCRHSDVLSYPRANMDIFSLKPSKESAVDCSRFPKDIVPILTLVSENISSNSRSSGETLIADPQARSKQQSQRAMMGTSRSCSLSTTASSVSGSHVREQRAAIPIFSSTTRITNFCDSARNGFVDRANTS